MDSWNCPWASTGAMWQSMLHAHMRTHVYTHTHNTYTHKYIIHTKMKKKLLRTSLIAMNTLEHTRSSTHELRWPSVALVQLPLCSPSPDWASHVGSPTSWGLCWLLSSLIYSLLLVTDVCTLYLCRGPFIASSTRASESCLETTRRGPSPAGHRGPLGCHQGEKTLSPGRDVCTWPCMAFKLQLNCTQLRNDKNLHHSWLWDTLTSVLLASLP